MSNDRNKGAPTHTVNQPGPIQQTLGGIFGQPPKPEHVIEGGGQRGTGTTAKEADKNWRKDKG